MSRHNFQMSGHKLFFYSYCATTVFYSLLGTSLQLCSDIASYCRDKYFASSSSLCRDINYCVATFFLWFFSTFFVTIISYVAIEFLSVVCGCCRDIKLLCHDILLLPYNAKSELYVATYFLP